MGSGSGKLALGIIRQLQARDDFTYSILEPSADLAQRQRQLLSSNLPGQIMRRVCWLDSLPADFEGVVVANEVMDALPVERFQAAQGGFEQFCVAADLTLETRPANVNLLKALTAIEADLGAPFAEGYESEVCLLLAPWLTSLSSMLTRGVLLLIDYGYPQTEYYAAERHTGTLACYYRHRAHDDPFHLPGLQDITAHVDFTAVVKAGIGAGLELLGYASQSAFLLDNDLLVLAEKVQKGATGTRDALALSQEVKTLTLPGEMGERFQVMALGKDYDYPLRGFRSQDLSYRL